MNIVRSNTSAIHKKNRILKASNSHLELEKYFKSINVSLNDMDKLKKNK